MTSPGDVAGILAIMISLFCLGMKYGEPNFWLAIIGVNTAFICARLISKARK